VTLGVEHLGGEGLGVQIIGDRDIVVTSGNGLFYNLSQGWVGSYAHRY
jgi:hypothetical protein